MTEADRHSLRRVLALFALAALAFLLWRLTGLWLLVFGSVLVAIILRSLASPIERYVSLSPQASLALAGLLIVLTLALAVWLAGNAVESQIEELSRRIPEAWNSVRSYVQNSRFGGQLTAWVENAGTGTGIISGLSQATAAVIGSIADLGLVIFGGIYLAARPDFYLRGVLLLVPETSRGNISDAAHACGGALRLWLKGQLISMVVVGVLITLGLWIVGLPSALALGLIAGLGEFVPIVGTLFAAIPALLLAFAQDTETALWTLLVYVVVQQLQGNVIMPLIQQHMVYLPPALTLFALMAFTLLFGPLGLLFAAPMTIVAYVAVKKLYVRGVLGEETRIPGEDES